MLFDRLFIGSRVLTDRHLNVIRRCALLTGHQLTAFSQTAICNLLIVIYFKRLLTYSHHLPTRHIDRPSFDTPSFLSILKAFDMLFDRLFIGSHVLTNRHLNVFRYCTSI